MTKEEIREIERVYQKPIEEVEELEIPTYIRNREENEARALCQMEEEWRQERAERLAKELGVKNVKVAEPL